MGIFSGKEIVNVVSNVNKLLDTPPDRTKETLTVAILNGSSILDASTRLTKGSLLPQVNKMVGYVHSGNYIHGSPTVLTNFEYSGVPANIDDVLFDSYDPNEKTGWVPEATVLNYWHTAQPRTVADRENFFEWVIWYDICKYLQNIIRHKGGFPNIFPFAADWVWDGNKIDTYRPINNKLCTFTRSPNQYNDEYYIANIYLDGVFQVSFQVINPKILLEQESQITHIAKYAVTYRRYDYSSGTSVLAETVHTSPIVMVWVDTAFTSPLYEVAAKFPIRLDETIQTNMYPIIPIKYNNAYIDTGSDESKQVTKVLKYLSLNKSDLINAVKQNPDENLIHDAYIMLGLKPHTMTTNEEYIGCARTLEYIYTWAKDYSAATATNILTFQEGNFKYTLEFKQIRKYSTWIGNITNPVLYAKSYTSLGMVNVGEPHYDPDNWNADTNTGMISYDQYEKTVLSITVPDEISPNFYTNTVEFIGAKGYFTIETDLGTRYSEYKPDTEDFLIPLLDYAIDHSPILMKEKLLYHSMVLVTNAIQYAKVKWYQRGFFKMILTALAVFLVIVNPANAVFITTLMSGGAIALTALVIAIGTYLAMNYAIEWLVENMGKIGVILATMLAVAEAVYTGKVSSFADALYKTVSTAIDTIKVYQENVFDDIVELNTKLSKTYDEKMEELTKVWDSINSGVPTDLLTLSSSTRPSSLIFNETPTEFYSRTTTTIDLPSITNGLVTNYHSSNLRLPLQGVI